MNLFSDFLLFDKLLIAKLRGVEKNSYSLPNSFIDFSADLFDWPALDQPPRIGYDRRKSIEKIRKAVQLRILTIEECEDLFVEYSDILRDRVEDFSAEELDGILLPIAFNLPLPFSTGLALQLLKRVNWTLVSDIWSVSGDNNAELLELRRMIVEEVEVGTIFSSLPAFSPLPFLNRTESCWDGGIGDFLKAASTVDLTIDELDFVISTGYWLLGDSWQDFQEELQAVLQKNSDRLYLFDDVDYRLYIRRSLFPM